MLFIFSTPVLIRHLWQLKTVVLHHLCLKHALLLNYNESDTNKLSSIKNLFRESTKYICKSVA